MSLTLPPEVEVRDEHDGVRYVLPSRKLGPIRLFGCLPIGFGILFTGFAVFWTVMAARTTGGILFALWGIPFIVAGLVPMAFGLYILAGRAEIALRGGRIVAIDRAGPFWWSRSRPADRLVRFRVGTKLSRREHVPPLLANIGVIKADFDGARKLVLAPGYPIDWLTALADDLSRRRELTASGSRPAVEQIPVGPLVPPEGAPVDQPAGSNATLERRPDGLLLEIPPLGLRKGSKGMVVFAGIWLGFTAAFTAAMVASRAPVPTFLFILLFWAIGIGLLLASFHLGRQRCRLEVTSDKVLFEQVSPIRERRRDWDRAAVAEIRVGPSGWEVNDRPVPELQIVPAGGKKFGLLAGRDEEELRWMASTLQEALRGSKPAAEKCPACGSTLQPPVVLCPRCGAPHHEVCWQDAGRCAAPGCLDSASND